MKKEINNVPEAFIEYFHELAMEAHGVMVQRQSGYGPGNIEALGPYGVFSRLAEDKCSRVATSLNGSIVDGKARVEGEWFNEGVRDALVDIANYALILIALGEGKWSFVSRGVPPKTWQALDEKLDERFVVDELR
jgi:hypothetical protein